MEWVFHGIAERKIQEAMDEGQFDNLPGKGRPLDLEDDPLTPPHLRAANRILKNAGVLPDWMQVDVEIEKACEENQRAWARMECEYPRRLARAEAKPAAGQDPDRARRDFAEWHARARRAYHAALRRVNSDITKLSLIAPSVQRVHIPYRLAAEMARFDAVFPPLPDVRVTLEDAPGPRESDRKLALKLGYTLDPKRGRTP